jgi:hypothetical protein
MNFKVWLHGLLAAVISAFSSAASGAIALPSVFSFTHDGFMNMLKLAAIPAMLAAFAYLKQSPMPTLSVTVKTEKTTTVTPA